MNALGRGLTALLPETCRVLAVAAPFRLGNAPRTLPGLVLEAQLAQPALRCRAVHGLAAHAIWPELRASRLAVPTTLLNAATTETLCLVSAE